MLHFLQRIWIVWLTLFSETPSDLDGSVYFRFCQRRFFCTGTRLADGARRQRHQGTADDRIVTQIAADFARQDTGQRVLIHGWTVRENLALTRLTIARLAPIAWIRPRARHLISERYFFKSNISYVPWSYWRWASMPKGHNNSRHAYAKK